MANIQPYEYQKRTNIEEHNDLVSKINEIVDVINQTNLDTITPKINKLEQDVTAINESVDELKQTNTDTVIPKINNLEQNVSTINNTDNVQNTDIINLKDKDVQIDNRLTLSENNIDSLTKSLVSDVVLMNGTTTGNMKARIERENAPSIDSNDYNIQKPVSVELVQGSASAMIKAKITLSDGTVLISDDFMFTTEAIGTDVYISSFTFKNGNVAGTISADIGLSNGSTLEANNFVVPTDPNVISTISDLQSRMTAVESGAGGLTELKATVDGHTTAINGLNTDVADLTTNKADVNNGNQTITAGTINANNINKSGISVATVNDIPDISGKVNIAQGIENAGKVLGINSSGNVEPTEVSSGGEVWEEVNLSNFPTNWVDGDIIRVQHRVDMTAGFCSSWTSAPTVEPTIAFSPDYATIITTHVIGNHDYKTPLIFTAPTGEFIRCVGFSVLSANELNTQTGNLMQYQGYLFNGNSLHYTNQFIKKSNITERISKIWRLKKSA